MAFEARAIMSTLDRDRSLCRELRFAFGATLMLVVECHGSQDSDDQLSYFGGKEGFCCICFRIYCGNS